MPCVGPFPDQALHPDGMDDSGLVLTEHSQFDLLMQEHLAPKQKQNQSPILVQLKLRSVSEIQFSQLSIKSSKMSHLGQDLPGNTTYSDEASTGSGNGNNGVPTLSAEVPSIVEELEASLVPQTTLQRPNEDLFSGQRIFLHAPQYHWHI